MTTTELSQRRWLIVAVVLAAECLDQIAISPSLPRFARDPEVPTSTEAVPVHG